MVYVPSLIEKKEISVAQEKEGGADAIEKTNGHDIPTVKYFWLSGAGD